MLPSLVFWGKLCLTTHTEWVYCPSTMSEMETDFQGLHEPASCLKATSKRHGGLDILRALAALFVIVNHATFLPAGSGVADKWCTAIIYAIVFPAVPLFVMMSGAFILNNDRNRNAWSFYWHSLKKLFPVCFVTFVVYFCLYTEYPGKFIHGTESLAQMVKHFFAWYEQGAAAPLWYICMLPGLYLVAPLIVLIRQKTPWFVHVALFAGLFWLSWQFRGWEQVYPWTAVRWLYWFVLGMILMNLAKVERKVGVTLAAIATACMLVVASVRLFLLMDGTDDFYSLHYAAYDDIVNSLLVVCMFVLFVQLKDWTPNWLVSKFAEVSLLIYLMHMLVLRLLMGVVYHAGLISTLHHNYVVSFLYGFSAIVLSFVLSWAVQSACGRVRSALSSRFARSAKAGI